MAEDLIHIKDLLLRGVIGVNDWEREVQQDILINITISTDLSQAAATDDIADTVDYKKVTKQIIKHVEEHQPFTVERLADSLARICLGASDVKKVRVRVEKPGALRFARSVGVEIERRPGDLE